MSAKPYTVILVRPDYLCDETAFGQDVYVANVFAEDEYKAVGIAQAEVFKADKKDGMKPESKEDYAASLVFEDHLEPKLWSWML